MDGQSGDEKQSGLMERRLLVAATCDSREQTEDERKTARERWNFEVWLSPAHTD